jgi:cytochrome c
MRDRTISRSAGAALLLVWLAAPSAAQELDGAKLFAEKTCLACHGPDAKTPILPEYPRLAGQSAPYALQQMKDIKSGARNNGNTAAMAGIMHLVNEEEMQALAEYISSLEPCGARSQP